MTGWENTPTTPTQTEQLAYDGEGRPVARQILYNGALVSSTFVGSLQERTTQSSGTTTLQYYLLDGVPLATSTNGTIAYVTRDHLGSATVALDSSGSATASRLYDVRGVPRYFSPSGTIPGAEGYGGAAQRHLYERAGGDGGTQLRALHQPVRQRQYAARRHCAGQPVCLRPWFERGEDV